MYSYDRRNAAEIPAFRDYKDALRWIEQKVKEYGGKRKFYSSPEYHEAYPIIQKLEKEQKRKQQEGDTWPDGRLKPKLGDKVYQTARGMFGMPARLDGVVVGSPGNLKIKITGGSSMLGEHIPSGRTVPYNESWSVIDDPAIAAREEKARLEKIERENADKVRKLQVEEAIEREAQKHRLRKVTNLKELKAGDEAYLIREVNRYEGTPGAKVEKITVTEVHSDWFAYDRGTHDETATIAWVRR